MKLPMFPDDQLEQISKCLAEARSHSQLTDLFERLRLEAAGVSGPKWQRILLTLRARQTSDGVGNNIAVFIEAIMSPVAFVGAGSDFSTIRERLNTILAFSGLTINEAGKLKLVQQANTLADADARASELRKKLIQRSIHPDVLGFCRPELLDANYFHAVLEATKSLGEKIRQKSGLSTDGTKLVEGALSGDLPLLAINSLRTDTEKSEQRGFVNLLNGVFGTFRNPTAHAPRVHWQVSEQDALDLLSVVSYAHRRLDSAVSTRPVQGNRS